MVMVRTKRNSTVEGLMHKLIDRPCGMHDALSLAMVGKELDPCACCDVTSACSAQVAGLMAETAAAASTIQSLEAVNAVNAHIITTNADLITTNADLMAQVASLKVALYCVGAVAVVLLVALACLASLRWRSRAASGRSSSSQPTVNLHFSLHGTDPAPAASRINAPPTVDHFDGLTGGQRLGAARDGWVPASLGSWSRGGKGKGKRA